MIVLEAHVKRTILWIGMLVISAALAFAAGTDDQYRDPDRLAQLIADNEPAHFLVDVRSPEEYAAGHIPTAINIPVGEIGDRPPTDDKNALIVVYCASGRRSARSQAILEGLGYVRVVDFGSISRWTGPIVSEDTE
jgi:rhodanese-related sulfurtransferase